jgi:hypothetical protein
MLPIIRLSISEAQNQLRTGPTKTSFFSDTAEPERNLNEALATDTATTATTTNNRIRPRRTNFRQLAQQTINYPAMTSTSIRRSRHQGILNYLSGVTVAVTSSGNNHARDASRHGRSANSHRKISSLAVSPLASDYSHHKPR